MDGSELVGRHGSEPNREENAGEKGWWTPCPQGWVIEERVGISRRAGMV